MGEFITQSLLLPHIANFLDHLVLCHPIKDASQTELLNARHSPSFTKFTPRENCVFLTKTNRCSLLKPCRGILLHCPEVFRYALSIFNGPLLLPYSLHLKKHNLFPTKDCSQAEKCFPLFVPQPPTAERWGQQWVGSYFFFMHFQQAQSCIQHPDPKDLL